MPIQRLFPTLSSGCVINANHVHVGYLSSLIVDLRRVYPGFEDTEYLLVPKVGLHDVAAEVFLVSPGGARTIYVVRYASVELGKLAKALPHLPSAVPAH